ncbi:GPP34 family phosphoprotein [Dactylosporangium sp. NBC_01737]|uniref:GOLPH3/VPS74 family protein n=1 Tax=Dactylosporangium sp. NBC_01737 TaxID=2975959 RepID=UPI002E0EF088|nr:GPP34 family phosphoprotein [Dactylosporangium sp. NBC_01737]
MGNGLADDVLLLALDDRGTNIVGDPGLDYGLAGAVLLDLMLADHLHLADNRVVVTDPTPTGDPVADAALDRIAADTKPRKPDAWIQPLTDGLRARLLERQVEAGVLRVERDKVLWVFPRTRYASATGAEPATETAVRRDLADAVNSTGVVPARTAALLGLAQAVGLTGKLFPDQDKKALQSRLDEIAEGNWAADAVRQSIAQIQAMIGAMAALSVATMVVTTS